MLNYAVKDAQTSLDVAIQIMVHTHWMKDYGGVWASLNVRTIPLPGVRKRVFAWFGISDEKRDRKVISRAGSISFSFGKEAIDEKEIMLDEQCQRQFLSGSDDSGIGSETREVIENTEYENEEHLDIEEEIEENQMETTELSEERITETLDSKFADQNFDDEIGDSRIVESSSNRIVETADQDEKSCSSRCTAFRGSNRYSRDEDIYWNEAAPDVRKFILSCKETQRRKDAAISVPSLDVLLCFCKILLSHP